MSAASNQRISVLFFTNLFPTPTDPTRGIFHLQLVRELTKICDVTIVCPLPWFPRWSFLKRFPRWYSFAEIPADYEIRGIRVHSPKYPMLPKVSGALQALLVYLGTFATIRRLHRQSKFDLINALWLYPDAVAAGWMAKRLKIPMVPAALGCDVNRMLNEPDKRGRILGMLSQAPHVISVSDGLRDTMATAGIAPSLVSTIANGVNTDLFFDRNKDAERVKLGLPIDRKIILFVGRLAEEKGLSTLVSAAKILHERKNDFLICIVGDGQQMTLLNQQAAALRVADRINFAGHQDHDAIPGWIGACDVFCLPSLREGCPNVVIEALSSGRPVVASRVGGIPDMVKDGCGTLVAAEDADALAQALEAAMSHPWNSEKIADSMSGNTWRAAAASYLDVYRDTIDATQ